MASVQVAEISGESVSRVALVAVMLTVFRTARPSPPSTTVTDTGINMASGTGEVVTAVARFADMRVVAAALRMGGSPPIRTCARIGVARGPALAIPGVA